MSLAKHIEITSSSPVSFQAAIDDGIKQAGKTIDNITGAWIKDQKLVMTLGGTDYRVTMKVTFVLND